MTEVSKLMKTNADGTETQVYPETHLDAVVGLDGYIATHGGSGGNQSAEVAAARGKYETLGMREDAQDNAIATTNSNLANKADKTYIDDYLSQVSYVPETVASLDELKTKYPNGKPGLFVTADNGHKYIWTDGAWKDVGVYQSNGIVDESIEDIKIKRDEIRQETLAFVPGVARKSNNIFDKNRVLIGRVIDTNPNLILSDNDDYFTSDWIYCRGESNVTIKTCTFIEFADKSLKRVSVITNSSNATITTEVPSGASYFRISAPSKTDKESLSINFGKALLEYESYDNKTGMAQLDKDVTSVLENIPENPEKIVYGKPSANLFNYESADNQVGKRVIPDKGTLADQSDYSVSHKIKFIKGLDYSFDKVVFYAFYKDGGDYISGGSNPVTVTAPDAYDGYMLVSAPNSRFDRIMVSQSSGVLDYETYGTKVLYDQMPDAVKDKLGVSRDISETLEVSPSYDESVVGWGVTKFDNIISAHDSITGSSATNQFLILVHPGTYDDWSAKWPSNTTATGYLGIQPKPYVFFESTDVEHPENYVLRWDGAAELKDGQTLSGDQAMQRALFHLAQNPRTTQIKGFTFDVKNCRYCLHIESAGRGAGNELLISNCVFKWGGNPRVTGFNGAPLGMGISSGESVTIENCKWDVVESVPDATAGHNNRWQMDAVKFVRPPAILKMVNCNFNGKNFRMDTVSTADQTDAFDEIHLLNCRNINRAYNGLQGSATENNWKADVRFTSIKVNDLNQP